MNLTRPRDTSSLFLVALGGFCCLLATLALAENSIYDELNSILLIQQREHPEATSEDHAVLLAKFLDSIKHKGKTTDLNMVRLLEEFVAMGRLAYSEPNPSVRCGERAYKLFAVVLEGLDAEKVLGGGMRLVDRVAFEWAIKRAEDCQKEHPMFFEQYYNFVPVEISFRLEAMLTNVIKRHAPWIEIDRSLLVQDEELRAKSSQALYSTFILAKQSIGGPGDVQAVYEAMVRLAQDDIEEKDKLDEEGQIRPSEIEKLFTKYLMAPCQVYSDNASKAIFDQARFNAVLLPEALSDDLKKRSFDFYLDWSIHRLCESLLESAQLFATELNIRHVWFRMLEKQRRESNVNRQQPPSDGAGTSGSR